MYLVWTEQVRGRSAACIQRIFRHRIDILLCHLWTHPHLHLQQTTSSASKWDIDSSVGFTMFIFALIFAQWRLTRLQVLAGLNSIFVGATLEPPEFTVTAMDCLLIIAERKVRC